MTGILIIGRPFVNIGILMDVRTSTGHRDRTPFGQRLLDARKHAGLTQKQVEAQIGVPQSTLADLEKNAHASGYTAQLAALYGCDALWLANGTGEGIPTSDPHVIEGVILRPVAHELSHHLQQHQDQSQVDVPVRYQGRATVAGGITLELLQSGGVVQAAFVGPEAFAIRIVGDELDPFAVNGDLLVCDPGQPVRGDERVLIELFDGNFVLCHLIAQREIEVTTLGIVSKVRSTIPIGNIRRIAAVIMVVARARWQPR